MRISDCSSDGCSSDLCLDVALHRKRLFEADRRHARRGERHILLIELRNEFRAKQAERRDGEEEESKAAGDERPGLGNRLVEQRQIALLQVADCPDFLLGNLAADHQRDKRRRSEEHTSELQSLMRISYAVFCLKKKTKT